MRNRKILTHPLVIAALALGMLAALSMLPSSSPSGDALPGLSLTRLGLALAAILALALGVVPMLKRLPGSTRKRTSRLACVEQLSLDAKHRIAIVSVDGGELLLGLQAEGVSLLKDLGLSHEPKQHPDGGESDSRVDLDALSRASFQQLLAEKERVDRVRGASVAD